MIEKIETTNQSSADGKIFLSYSRADMSKATALKNTLDNEKINVFRDIESIRIGDNWMQKLQEALVSCSAFVLLIGEKGIERWVGVEVEVALNRNISPHNKN